MYRIDVSTAAVARPAPAPIGTEGYWQSGNPVTATPATIMDQDWFNALQEELVAVVDAAGLPHSKTTLTQLRDSIKLMIQQEAGNYGLDTGAANAYVVALTPAIAAYTNGLVVRFRAVHANTGASTLNAGGGVATLADDDGAALLGGAIPANALVTAVYDQPAASFLVLSVLSAGAPAVQGARKNLKIVNDAGSPNTVMDITADELVLEDGAGATVKLAALAVTVNSAAAGVGGLDTGALAAGTAYHIWAVAQPGGANPSAIMSLSSTAPTMPAGYTLKARVGGTAITDASKHFLRLLQLGEDVQFTVTPATNTANMLLLAVGTSGSVTTPTYAALSLVGLIPSTALRARFAVGAGFSSALFTLLAPNPNYGPAYNGGSPATSTTNVPFFQRGSNSVDDIMEVDMLLESMNAYYASNASNSAVWLTGFKENL